MGFQTADLVEFARSLHRLPGVSGVWLDDPSDSQAELIVTVRGLDPLAFADRTRVYKAIETTLERLRPAMEESGFIFNYSVQAEEEEIAEPFIPSGSKQIA